MSNPTVSVIMPVYNGENYLRSAVESVLAQTFRDFEVVVVDDGSKDSTPEIAQSYGDPVRYVRQENAGVAAAVNRGIREARGRYFAWLSHDDLYAPEKLEKQLRALESSGGPGVCYTDIKWIDGEGKVFDEKELPLPPRREVVRAILLGEPVSFAAYSLMCDLSCFERVGPYDVKKRHTQDADMLIRLAREFPFVRVPGKLTSVREHGTRDSYRPTFVAEAQGFYRAWLDDLRPEELSASPDSAMARAMSRKQIADTFYRRGNELWTGLARGEYRKAVAETPLAAPAVLGSFASHYFRKAAFALKSRRNFYRVGLRSALRGRLGQR
ncbi:MAG: glycosyltransferase [Acidobacteria bacterium]|nr:glycosyltransferase [Acidobacteriota bacterium]